MKKLTLLLGFALAGCASAGKGMDPSPVCKYQVDGLTCEREQVWQMRDVTGDVYVNNHTRYWFKTHEDCENHPAPSKEYLANQYTSEKTSCGSKGESYEGGSADVTNYYIYSNGVTDGNFYYMINSSLAVTYAPKDAYHAYGRQEWFVALFTSKSALEKFQKAPHANLSSVVDVSPSSVKKIKVERMY